MVMQILTQLANMGFVQAALILGAVAGIVGYVISRSPSKAASAAVVVGIAAAILIHFGGFGYDSAVIRMGYVTADGEEVYLDQGQDMNLYRDPQTLTAYASSDKNKEIEYVFADMYCNVESDASAVEVEYSYEATSELDVLQSSGMNTKTITEDQFGQNVKLARSRIAVYTLERLDPASGSYKVTWNLDLTATARDQTDTASATGEITFTWEHTTLSISASMDSGTLQQFTP
jgi:type II secretory pathway pseudopilin PulG